MARYRVACVTIDPGSQYDDCRCIESIGFPAPDGGIVTKTPAAVYEWVEHHGHTVIVEHNKRRTEVHGATHGNTNYVRTEPTNTNEDTLLEQPRC